MGEIVLLLKLNGRTDFPSDANAISPLQATGEDAIQFGMPLIVWSHPRGETVDSKCGTDFFYAIDYGARVASEVGTDVVKLTFPHPEKRTNVKAEYDKDFPTQEAMNAVVHSANKTLVLLSGGRKDSDEVMFSRGSGAMDAGATGFIFGRNVWQRTRRNVGCASIVIRSFRSEQG